MGNVASESQNLQSQFKRMVHEYDVSAMIEADGLVYIDKGKFVIEEQKRMIVIAYGLNESLDIYEYTFWFYEPFTSYETIKPDHYRKVLTHI